MLITAAKVNYKYTNLNLWPFLFFYTHSDTCTQKVTSNCRQWTYLWTSFPTLKIWPLFDFIFLLKIHEIINWLVLLVCDGVEVHLECGIFACPHLPCTLKQPLYWLCLLHVIVIDSLPGASCNCQLKWVTKRKREKDGEWATEGVRERKRGRKKKRLMESRIFFLWIKDTLYKQADY